jgi:O-antigen/teichoic acid export membrane protein
VVLTVTILARLFGQLGVAVTSHARDAELRPFVDRALALALLLGAAGIVAILAAGAVIDVVVGLGHGVDGAVAVWTAAYFATSLFALAAARDIWLPSTTPMVLDRHGRAILRLALVMGAVQIVNLIGYRIELFILDRYEGLAQVGI